MRFDVSAYGEAVCGILARASCHRMQYFFDREVADATVVERPFTAAEISEYAETSEFAKVAAAPSTPGVAKRVQQIREVFA